MQPAISNASRSEGLVTVPLTPNRAIAEHLATINGPRLHSPSVHWPAAAVIAETRAMSKRYPSAAEFLELSEKFVTAREAATGLRPEAAYDDINNPEVRKNRYNRYIDAARDLYLFTETRQPFLPEIIYDALKQFDHVTWKEAVQQRRGDPNNPEYWDNALKNSAEIVKLASAVLLIIRDRIQRWEAFDPGP